MVVKDDGIDAPQHCVEGQHETGKTRQCLCPVSTNGLLATQDAGRLSHDLDDERRRELKIMGVVRQHAVEAATIPSCDPFSCEMVCGGLVNHGAPCFCDAQLLTKVVLGCNSLAWPFTVYRYPLPEDSLRYAASFAA